MIETLIPIKDIITLDGNTTCSICRKQITDDWLYLLRTEDNIKYNGSIDYNDLDF